MHGVTESFFLLIINFNNFYKFKRYFLSILLFSM